MPMQTPTCTGIRVRSTADAHIIFHAVSVGILPMITRRLDTEERRSIGPGCVFVWEERGGPNTEPMGLGIERWTDSIRWGPSRVRDEFLFYQEREPEYVHVDMSYDSDGTPSPLANVAQFPRESLVKQTYSVFVETTKGRRKWHLIAYFTQESADYLQNVDDIPLLANLRVPAGVYKSARSAKGTGRRVPDRPFPYLWGAASNPRTAPYPPPPYTSPTAVVWPAPQPITPCRIKPIPLAPLEYLEKIPPPPRHPEDEKALMSFVIALRDYY